MPLDSLSVLQFALNLIFAGGFFIVWARLRRPPQDDPRLSRGLQLLQTKISVIEDLSNRTDKQVEQLVQMLDQKSRQLQAKILEAEKQMHKVDQSMHRSLEVAEIFQDKIPHDEILERKATVKYVMAAQMCHNGSSIEDVMEKVDLPREQIEFIAKVNKEQLRFNAEDLPEWAQSGIAKHAGEGSASYEDELNEAEARAHEWSDMGMKAEPDLENLKKLGEQFKQACAQFEEEQRRYEKNEIKLPDFKSAFKPMEFEPISDSGLVFGAKSVEDDVLDLQDKTISVAKITSPPTAKSASVVQKVKVLSSSQQANVNRMQVKEVASTEVKKVLFPRVDLNDNLG